MISHTPMMEPRFQTLDEAEQYRVATDYTLAIYRLRIYGDPVTWEFAVSPYPASDIPAHITIDKVIRYDIFNRPLEYPGWKLAEDIRQGKQRETDCACTLCWNNAKCRVCKLPICFYHGELDILSPTGELVHLAERL